MKGGKDFQKMQKKNKFPPGFAVAAVGLSGILFMTGCTGEYDVLDKVADSTTVGESITDKINDMVSDQSQNVTYIYVAGKIMVRLTVLNTGAKAKWSSSKPKVASVTSEGYVTARSAGKAKITAVVGKKKLYCNVTVKVKPGEEVKMEFKDCKVQVGKTTRLRLMNIVGLASWKSSNTKIATVNANGDVTGRKTGSATITATYHCKRYTAKVTVISGTTSGTSVIRRKAPLADSGVLNAFDKLGFKYAYDPNITGFTGKFSAKEHRIIVRREEDDCIYHELGHFVAWVAGDVDYKKEWKAIYDKEKSKVTYFNKGYATQNPKEYFADAYKDYILHRSSLSSTRPLTYKYVKAAVSKVNAMTSTNFERMHKLYDSMWNKYGA